ncbi:unnamed protein product [Ceratitis capitata]|uniref:(Mediterranean fruit fly) hypothetical protein n=1 Tax=Ceratitis capitata TaxID=7213 RepID=A0A811VLN3_CERCA|nr:unnamed protein product [Ceratitis capitata]
MMPNAALTILCLALIGATVATPLAPVAKINADNGVLNMLAEANALGGSADPEITTECFNYYMPILNQLSTNFSVQYEQCVSVATKATANLTASAAQSRLSLVNETDAICNSFTACNSDNDTLDFFNCYASASSADILEVYTLSDSASNAAIALKGGLEQIKNVENSCTNNAQTIIFCRLLRLIRNYMLALLMVCPVPAQVPLPLAPCRQLVLLLLQVLLLLLQRKFSNRLVVSTVKCIYTDQFLFELKLKILATAKIFFEVSNEIKLEKFMICQLHIHINIYKL